jgi:hypothetical protein
LTKWTPSATFVWKNDEWRLKPPSKTPLGSTQVGSSNAQAVANLPEMTREPVPVVISEKSPVA